jgi:hypothetical protein
MPASTVARIFQHSQHVHHVIPGPDIAVPWNDLHIRGCPRQDVFERGDLAVYTTSTIGILLDRRKPGDRPVHEVVAGLHHPSPGEVGLLTGAV